MRRLPFGGLRFRLMLPIGIAAVASTAILAYGALVWRQHEIGAAADAARQLAHAIAAVHDRHMGNARRTLTAAAEASSAVQEPALTTILDVALQLAPDYSNIGVCDQ